MWEKIGTLPPALAEDSGNKVYWAKDGAGSILHVVRKGSIFHDVNIRSSGNSLGSLNDFSPLKDSTGRLADLSMLKDKAYFSSIGSNRLALSDGSSTLLGTERGPAVIVEGSMGNPELDRSFYSLEGSGFPNCRFFIVGPNHTIFGTGNPKKPMTIYLSEPAGAMDKEKTGVFTRETLSKVDLLLSGATKITSLSVNAGNVLVHTDNGVYLLKAPTGEQAFTGFRTEQVNTSPLSGSVNYKTSVGSQESMPYYLGCDGQIYMCNSVTQGPEDKTGYADEDQASWKSKGGWEYEHPSDLKDSFAAYNAQTGLYLVYMPTKGYEKFSNYELLVNSGQADCEAVDQSYLIPSPPKELRIVTTPAAPYFMEGVKEPKPPVWVEATQLVEPVYFLWGLSSPASPSLLSEKLRSPSGLYSVTSPQAASALASVTRPEAPTELEHLPIPDAADDLEHVMGPASGNFLFGLSSPQSPISLQHLLVPDQAITGLLGIPQPSSPSDLAHLLVPEAGEQLAGEPSPLPATDLSGLTTPAAPSLLESSAAAPTSATDLEGLATPVAPSSLLGPPYSPFNLYSLIAPTAPASLSGENPLNWETRCRNMHKYMDPSDGGTEQLYLTGIIDRSFRSLGPVDVTYESRFNLSFKANGDYHIPQNPEHVFLSGAEYDTRKRVKGIVAPGVMNESVRSAEFIDNVERYNSLDCTFAVRLNYVGFYELGKPWLAQNPNGGLAFENVGPSDSDGWRRVFRLVPDVFGRYAIENFDEKGSRELELAQSGHTGYEIKNYHYTSYAKAPEACLTDTPCVAENSVYSHRTNRTVLEGAEGKYLKEETEETLTGDRDKAYLVEAVDYKDRDNDSTGFDLLRNGSRNGKTYSLPTCWVEEEREITNPLNPGDGTTPSPSNPNPGVTTNPCIHESPVDGYYNQDATSEFGGGMFAMFTVRHSPGTNKSFFDSSAPMAVQRTPYVKWASVGGSNYAAMPHVSFTGKQAGTYQYVLPKYNGGGSSAPWNNWWGLVGMRWVSGIDLSNIWVEGANRSASVGLMRQPGTTPYGFAPGESGAASTNAWYFDYHAWGFISDQSRRYVLLADENGDYRFITLNRFGHLLPEWSAGSQSEAARGWMRLSHNLNGIKQTGRLQPCDPVNAYYGGHNSGLYGGNADGAIVTVASVKSGAFVRELFGGTYTTRSLRLPQF